MTLAKLIDIVVNDFKKSMLDEGFESFNEMAKCYMWDSSDIKQEVSSIINDQNNAYMDEESGEITINDDSIEPYKYKMFIAKVRKALKSIEEDEEA